MQTVWEKGPREDLWKDQLTLKETFNRVSFGVIKATTLAGETFLALNTADVPSWWVALGVVNYLVCAQAQGQLRSRAERRLLKAAGEASWRKVPRLKNFVRCLSPL